MMKPVTTEEMQQTFLTLLQQQQQQQTAASHGLLPYQLLLPQQMQHLFQQQSALLQSRQQKMHDRLMQQLGEQLQANMGGQGQLLPPASSVKKEDSSAMKDAQLHAQQQQLVQQLQLMQRHFLLSQGLTPGVPAPAMSVGEMTSLWKDVEAVHSLPRPDQADDVTRKTNGRASSPASDHRASVPMATQYGNSILGAMRRNDATGLMMNGDIRENGDVRRSSSSESSAAGLEVKDDLMALYTHGLCRWPGCEALCDDVIAFRRHLDTEHQLDDRSTAQSRVQLQVVQQLQSQLNKEKDRLQAMMLHLQLKQAAAAAASVTNGNSVNQEECSLHLNRQSAWSPPSVTSRPGQGSLQQQMPPTPPPALPPSFFPSLPSRLALSIPQPPSSQLPLFTSSSALTSLPLLPSSLLTPHRSPPIHHASTEGQGQGDGGRSSGGGAVRRRVYDKCTLSVSSEIDKNRDFYKTNDVRPPFTYASLIRQAIIESVNKQLTLNEVYQWFVNNFAYFRRNEATWKNAVRHNLSLHKCFMRVENVKGAVWTVDELEFYRRRPQKLVTGGTPLVNTPNLCVDVNALNSSLKAALADKLMVPHLTRGGYEHCDDAEDLSTSRRESMDGVDDDLDPDYSTAGHVTGGGMMNGRSLLSHASLKLSQSFSAAPHDTSLYSDSSSYKCRSISRHTSDDSSNGPFVSREVEHTPGSGATGATGVKGEQRDGDEEEEEEGERGVDVESPPASSLDPAYLSQGQGRSSPPPPPSLVQQAAALSYLYQTRPLYSLVHNSIYMDGRLLTPTDNDVTSRHDNGTVSPASH